MHSLYFCVEQEERQRGTGTGDGFRSCLSEFRLAYHSWARTSLETSLRGDSITTLALGIGEGCMLFLSVCGARERESEKEREGESTRRLQKEREPCVRTNREREVKKAYRSIQSL